MKKVLFLASALIMSAMMWAGEKITTVAGITSGNKYYVGATQSSKDYYFYVDGSAKTASTKGVAKEDVADAVALTFTAVTDGWTIQFENDLYLGLKNSKDNGAVQVVENAVVWTIDEDTDKGLLKLHPNDYYLQKNNSGTQFGSYKNTQTNVWLESAGAAPTPATLDSLVIKGKAEKMEYETGEAFDPAGLEVWGIYTKTVKHDSISQIKSGIAWTIDPETFAEASDNASVTLVASYKELTTADTTITGIKVTEKPAPVGVAYNKVTSEPTNWAGEYILVYEVDGAARVFNGLDAIEDFDNAEIKDNVIIGAFNTIILEAAEGGYLVKIKGGDNNDKYINSDKDENGLKFGETGAVMTVSYDTESASTMIANPAGAVLRYNKTSGQDRFRFYKSTSYTNQQPVQLYKASNTPTAMPEVMENANVSKQLINGQLIIIRDNVRYNVAGQQL